MAIVGVGTDILEINRISDILNKSDRFLYRVFTDNERTYLEKKGSKAESVAAFWCAKEAVAKALGTGIRGFELKDIEILHDELGKPIVQLHNNAKLFSHKLGIGNIQLSISHSDNYAVAFCVMET
ncbi:MAG: holo-ACP synthase [Proteocatella sp.]